jgi:5-methylcytosine-specific restriction endonuclease McrA
MSNLEVHHREFRSQSGDDSEQNLITLCSACHARYIAAEEVDAGGDCS